MPAWSPFRPPAQPELPSDSRTVFVLTGENTSAVARRLGISVPELVDANRHLRLVIVAGRPVFARLHPGQELFLPPRVVERLMLAAAADQDSQDRHGCPEGFDRPGSGHPCIFINTGLPCDLLNVPGGGDNQGWFNENGVCSATGPIFHPEEPQEQPLEEPLQQLEEPPDEQLEELPQQQFQEQSEGLPYQQLEDANPPQASPPETPEPEKKSSAAPWVLGGLAVAAAGTAVYLANQPKPKPKPRRR